jgi:PEP-CTERM motif
MPNKGDVVRFTSLKLSVLALAVIGALAIAPAAMATTCPAGDTCMDLTQSNLNVAGPYGTVELSQNGSNVDVTIVMNAGFGVKLSGGDLLVNVTPGTTLSTFMNIVANGTTIGTNLLKTNGTIGSFTFSFDQQLKTNQTQASLITFTLNNVTISQLTGFGIHLCVVAAQGNGCALTGFAVTGGTPPAVPEPGTLGMLGTGLVGIAGLVRRRFIS